MKNIYLNFIEEGIMNPKYWGYRGGRIEVILPKEEYSSEEIRFFTKKSEEFEEFRDKWDMKYITKTQLGLVKTIVKNMFREKI